MKIKYKWSMGHPWAEFKEILESRTASVTTSKKTDGFPVRLFSENKMVWLKLVHVLLEKKNDTQRNLAKNHLDTFACFSVDQIALWV